MASLAHASQTIEDAFGKRGPAPDAFLIAAARLTSQGVNVLPLKGKAAALPWKDFQTERVCDLPDETVDAYLTGWFDGHRHGLGIVAGAISGVVVVDVDGDNGQRLYDALAGDVRTVTTITRSGRHYWFQHPGVKVPNRARVRGVKLDVKADRGIAVCPPTQGYRWLISPFVQDSPAGMWPPARLPGALSRVLWPKRETKPLTPKISDILKRGNGDRYAWAALDSEAEEVRHAPEGTRNHQLNASVFAIARFVKDGTLPETDVRQVFLQAARVAGLPDFESEKTIDSALRSRT